MSTRPETEPKTIAPAAPRGILQLEDKGIKKGMEKGMEKLLKKGIETEFICENLDVSPEYVERIRKDYLTE